MPTDYETIRQQILEELRDDRRIPKAEVPTILKDLDAYIYTLKRVPALLVERFCTNRRVPERTLREQASQLHDKCSQLQDAMEAGWPDLAFQVTVAELHHKAIVRSDNFDLIHADQLKLGTVDSLLAIPRIYKNVKSRGSRLLVVRPRNRKTIDVTDDAFCLEHACNYTICESEEQLVASLSQNDAWLFIFGCGSGFVTDLCLYVYSPVARTVMPVTAAMANVLKDNVERMAKEQWARRLVDGVRVWRARERT